MSGLVRYANDGAIEPDLAERWETSSDGLEWTFHLRDDVRWHRGFGELTAQDVVYSFERVRDPETSSPYASDFAMVDSIQAVDDHTVRFTLSRPFSPFIHRVVAFRGGFVVNQRAIEQFGADYSSNAVGTGPFELTSFGARDTTVTAFDDYYRGAPALESIRFITIEDNNTAALALQSGEVDVIRVLVDEVASELAESEDIRTVSHPLIGMRAITFNQSIAPFDNVLVRRAIHHATNKEGIVDFLLSNIGAVTLDSLIVPGVPHYSDDVPTYEYDLDKARQLLSEAGYPQGFSTRLSYFRHPIYTPAFQVLQEDLRQIGIQLELVELETAAWTASRDSEPMAIISQVFAPDPDSFLFGLTHSSQFPPGLNYMRYSNPRVDELLEEGRITSDPDELAAIYAELQRIIAEDSPAVPLLAENVTLAMRGNIEGLEGGVLVGMFGYWLYPVTKQP